MIIKNIVIYYSKTGNNEYLASVISGQLSCPSEAAVEKRKRTIITFLNEIFFKKLPEINNINSILDDYDNIILISPVWGGIVAAPMISFIEKYKNNIKNYSFITICGGALGENLKLENYLVKKLNKKPKFISQLTINDLLQGKDKNKAKYTSKYKFGADDLKYFKDRISKFTQACLQ